MRKVFHVYENDQIIKDVKSTEYVKSMDLCTSLCDNLKRLNRI
jgi:hypothetical protein